jgi:hypothetical protein
MPVSRNFTAVVYSGEDWYLDIKVKPKNVQKSGTKAQSASWVRASISFPHELYRTLEDLAKKKKVSLAWVVRDAAEKYVARTDLGDNR